jgi:multiple antibiotic resistance protein
MPTLGEFLQLLALVPVTLLPIINPLGTAPVFTMTAGDEATGRVLARQVAINCWFILVASMLVGTYVLEVFGISIPIVRVGGGLIVAASGWRMLNRSEDDEVRTAVKRSSQQQDLTRTEVIRRSFFPITFPLTTGPGTIATSIAIGAGLPRQPALYVASAFVVMLGATLTVAAIYLVYRNAAALMARLGEVGALVMTRMMAFVLLCIGIEIIWTGWAELNGIAAR